MPATFRQIQDFKKSLPEYGDLSMDEFSKLLNEATESSVADAGRGGFVATALKSGSTGFDRLLEASGQPYVGGKIGGFLGGLIGGEEGGRRAGEALPRAMYNLVPAIAGGILTATGVGSPVGVPLAALGLGASAGLTGVDVYEKTDSLGQAAFSGGLTMAAPSVGRFFGKLGADKLGSLIGPKVAEFTGSQLGTAGTFMGTDFVQHLASGGEASEFFTKDMLAANVIGNLPFAALDAVRMRSLQNATSTAQSNQQVAGNVPTTSVVPKAKPIVKATTAAVTPTPVTSTPVTPVASTSVTPPVVAPATVVPPIVPPIVPPVVPLVTSPVVAPEISSSVAAETQLVGKNEAPVSPVVEPVTSVSREDVLVAEAGRMSGVESSEQLFTMSTVVEEKIPTPLKRAEGLERRVDAGEDLRDASEAQIISELHKVKDLEQEKEKIKEVQKVQVSEISPVMVHKNEEFAKLESFPEESMENQVFKSAIAFFRRNPTLENPESVYSYAINFLKKPEGGLQAFTHGLAKVKWAGKQQQEKVAGTKTVLKNYNKETGKFEFGSMVDVKTGQLVSGSVKKMPKSEVDDLIKFLRSFPENRNIYFQAESIDAKKDVWKLVAFDAKGTVSLDSTNGNVIQDAGLSHLQIIRISKKELQDIQAKEKIKTKVQKNVTSQKDITESVVESKVVEETVLAAEEHFAYDRLKSLAIDLTDEDPVFSMFESSQEEFLEILEMENSTSTVGELKEKIQDKYFADVKSEKAKISFVNEVFENYNSIKATINDLPDVFNPMELSTGEGFIFSLNEISDNKILRVGKPPVTTTKDGTLSIKTFKETAGKFGILRDVEIKFYEQLVPEAFKGGRIHLETLWNKLKNLDNVVKIDVKEMNSFPGMEYYHEVSAFDPILYSPIKIEVSLPEKLFGLFWEKDNVHESVDNVVGTAMAQIVPAKKLVSIKLPNPDEPIMFVEEVQSRLEQHGPSKNQKVFDKTVKAESLGDYKYRITAILDENPYKTTVGAESAEAAIKTEREIFFPVVLPEILPIQAELVLKATIKEAQKRGISKIVITSAQTAMDTQQHFSSEFEAGMEMNYGVKIPSIMKGIMDTSGTPVEFGTHKNRVLETDLYTGIEGNLFDISGQIPKTKRLFLEGQKLASNFESVYLKDFLTRFYKEKGLEGGQVEGAVARVVKFFKTFGQTEGMKFGKTNEFSGFFMRKGQERTIALNPALDRKTLEFAAVHEIAHDLIDSVGRGLATKRQQRVFESARVELEEMNLDERRLVMQEVERLSGVGMEEVWGKTLGSVDEVMANMVGGLVKSMVESPKGFLGFVRYMPKAVGDFFREVRDFVGKTFEGAKALLFGSEKGLVNVGANVDVRNFVGKMSSTLSEMRKSERIVDREVEQFMEMGKMFPGGLGEKIVSGQDVDVFGIDSEVFQTMGLKENSDGFRKVLSDFLTPLMHLGERWGKKYPVVREMSHLLFNQTAVKDAFVGGMYAKLGGVLDASGFWKLTKNSPMLKVHKNKVLNEALDKFSAFIKSSGQDVQSVNMDVLLPNLSKEERLLVKDMGIRVGGVLQDIASRTKDMMQELLVSSVARRMVVNKRIKDPLEAEKYSRMFLDLVHDPSNVPLQQELTKIFGKQKLALYGKLMQEGDHALQNKELVINENVWWIPDSEKLRKSPLDDKIFRAFKEVGMRGKQLDLNELDITTMLEIQNKLNDFEFNENSLQHVMNYAEFMGGVISKTIRESKFSLYSEHVDLKNGEGKWLLDQVKTNIRNFDVPDSEFGRQITKANFMMFMAFNGGSHLVEGVSAMINVPAHLTGVGAGLIESMTVPIKAMKEVGLAALRNVQGKGETYSSKEHQGLIDWATDQRKIGVGVFTEVSQEAMKDSTMEVINARRAGQGKEPFGPKEWFKMGYSWMSKAGLKLYGIPTQVNEKATLISFYDVLRKKGLDVMAARNEAVVKTKLVNASAGRANRPTEMFSTKGHWRTMSQALNSLQAFNFATINNLVTYIKGGWGNNLNLSSSEKQLYKKSARQMVFTTFAAAGALGLPGIGAALAMLERTTDLEPNRRIRELLSKLGGDDQELGGMIADIGMRGLSHAIGGPDLGIKFGMGNILGTNNWDGWSLEGLAGPTGGLMKNLLTGAGQVLRGELGQATESFLPASMKRLWQLYRDDGKVISKSGEMLFAPTDGEKLWMAAGLSPSRLTKIRDRDRILAQTRDLTQRDVISFYDDVAESYFKGDVLKGQQLLRERRGKDSDFDVENAVDRVAERVERLSFPRDPRNKATAAQSDRISAILGTMRPEIDPNELQRLQLRNLVTSSLSGNIKIPTLRQLTVAAQVDNLLRSNPTMTRVDARALISKSMISGF